MATILEFDELPEGSQVTFATQSGGPIIAKAVEAPVIPPPPDPPTPSEVGGVVSFLTVARVSAKRLLDAPFAMVATWTDGQPIYTRSFGGARWHWQADFPAVSPTDNETTCRPSSWAGQPGAAVRSLAGNRFTLSQTAWQVDSTAADNEGAGTLADPVKTDIEIGRRWGPRPTIEVPIVVTYAQSPATITNYDLAAVAGGSLTLTAPRTIDQTVTITAVTIQNRTTHTPLSITAAGLGAADVGKIAIISTSAIPANVGAYAAILRNVGGGNVVVSKFGTFSPTAPFTEITPAVGDTVQVCTLVQLAIGNLRFGSKMQAAQLAAPPRNCYVIDSLRINGGGIGSIYSESLVNVFIARGIISGINLGGENVGQNTMCGGLVAGNISAVAGGFARFRKSGFLNGGLSNQSIGVQIDPDTYFENSFVQANRGSSLASQGAAFFNRATVSQAMLLFASSNVTQTGAVADWGTGNAGQGLNVRNGGCYSYATKPNINGGLGAGRESAIGGVDTLYSAYPASGAVNLTNFAAATLFA